jgi:hypothetical protein
MVSPQWLKVGFEFRAFFQVIRLIYSVAGALQLSDGKNLLVFLFRSERLLACTGIKGTAINSPKAFRDVELPVFVESPCDVMLDRLCQAISNKCTTR